MCNIIFQNKMYLLPTYPIYFFQHVIGNIHLILFGLRGRSQLSTFMKAYTLGGGGLGPPYAFLPKINIYF